MTLLITTLAALGYLSAACLVGAWLERRSRPVRRERLGRETDAGRVES